MIALNDFKKALGPIALKMTDEQIEKLREKQDLMAGAIFEMLLKRRGLKLDSKPLEQSK